MACGEIFIQLRIILHNLVLIYGTRMCFAKFWPFCLRHQHIWLGSGICTMKDEHRIYRHPVLCISSWSTLLGLNKIPFLLYEQLFIYTTISLSFKELRSKMFGQHPGYFKAVFLKQTRIIIVSIYKYTVYIMFWIMMLYDCYYY